MHKKAKSAPQSVTLTRDETPATAPARRAAAQVLVNFTDRQLAHFHWAKANHLMANLEHKIRDYSDDAETSDFDHHDMETVAPSIPAIIEHLGHVLAIANESHARYEAECQAREKREAPKPQA